MALKRKKGFTLIELLVTILILSLIFVIAFVFIGDIFGNVNSSVNKITYSNISKAAVDYASEFKTSDDYWYNEPNSSNQYSCTTIQQLINMGFLKGDLVDAETNEKIPVDTIIKVTRDQYKVIDSDIEKNAIICDRTKPELQIVIDGPSITIDSNVWYYDEIGSGQKTTFKIIPIEKSAVKLKQREYYIIDSSGNKKIFYTSSNSDYNEYSDEFNKIVNNAVSYGKNIKICGYLINANDIDNTVCKTINLDISNPDTPVVSASDNLASNKWHINNFNINIINSVASPSGIVYKYGTNAQNINSILSGSVIENVNSNTDVSYYIKTCNNVNICSDYATYSAIKDSEKPSINATVSGAKITAIIKDNISGVVQYKISTESAYVNSGFVNITRTTEQKTIEDTVKVAGTYYIWVKDAAGNVNNASVEVTEVDTTPPAFTSGEITFEDDYSNVKFSNIVFNDEGTGINKLYYIIKRNSTTPTSEQITSTSPIFYENAIEVNARYYGWVKAVDNAGNETIKYIGYAVYKQEVWSSDTRAIVDEFSYATASEVVYRNPIAKDYSTLNEVSAVVTSTSTDSIMLRVTGGTAIDNGTTTVSANWYYAEEDSVCYDYECNYGGRLSGSKCIKLTTSQMSYCNKSNCSETIEWNSYIQAYEVYTTYDPMYYSCSSIGGGPWINSKWYTPAGSCPEGYSAGTWRSSNDCPTSNSACTAVNAKMGTCTGYGETTCKWDGDYRAECVDEDIEYYCLEDDEFLVSDKCYSCSKGTFNRSTKKCVVDSVIYKYYVAVGCFIRGE